MPARVGSHCSSLSPCQRRVVVHDMRKMDGQTEITGKRGGRWQHRLGTRRAVEDHHNARQERRSPAKR